MERIPSGMSALGVAIMAGRRDTRAGHLGLLVVCVCVQLASLGPCFVMACPYYLQLLSCGEVWGFLIAGKFYIDIVPEGEVVDQFYYAELLEEKLDSWKGHCDKLIQEPCLFFGHSRLSFYWLWAVVGG